MICGNAANAQRLDIIWLLYSTDISLDSPLIGFSEREASLAERIRGALREAFDTLIGHAGQEKVDFIVVAGDLYDGNWCDYQTGLFFVGQIGRLAAKGVPVHLHRGTSVDEDEPQVITEPVEVPGG